VYTLCRASVKLILFLLYLLNVASISDDTYLVHPCTSRARARRRSENSLACQHVQALLEFIVVDVSLTAFQVSLRNRVLILFDWLKAKVFGRDMSMF
jgi:hypothetical protein